MNKFFEVFNTLKVPEEIGVYLTDTEVTRVSKTSTNSLARVYLSSERLISKQVIYKAEDALKKQIFRMKNMDVRIIDRYRLSKQYTPVKIMEIYYDSILFELEKYWTLEYNLLKNSQWEFDGEHCLVLTLEDGFLSRTYAASHDLVFFVSGKKSSNGKMLFSECKKINPNSHLIDSVEEIDNSLLTGASSIGVCGATSTPKWLMEEISKAIQSRLTGQ